ncbi:hypothetical protein [Hymenobacter weizhouensis]|uniref:hypothetical protein n=1 Tax=Hymenobacter sp. YIM 151500-1 TaxID=2987689 RepID=UPI0022280AA5|nr:hypothetical protein [Hymenobacter sp. YIM 151500-1]UYZ64406.1 hypothetical protein OIS53_06025 [Hymenobacter sp. YIM 151500-1]
MGKQAGGAPGPFVMPPPRSYAYTPPVAEPGPVAPTPVITSPPEEVAPNYSTVSMDPDYEGEETGAVWGTKVQYLSEEQRKAFELSVDSDGKLRNASGELFDTQGAGTVTGKGKAIFVMSPDGKIYASLHQQAGIFHHSSFLSGAPVAAAGEVEVHNGVVKMVSNRSGHYMPDQSFTYQFIEQLWRRGVKGTENIHVVDFDH